MSELNGKVALATGASRGIGRAIALAPAQAGCDVAINYRLSSKEAETVRVEIIRAGRRAIAVAADVSRVDEVEGLFMAVEHDLGPIDVRANKAGWKRRHRTRVKGKCCFGKGLRLVII